MELYIALLIFVVSVFGVFKLMDSLMDSLIEFKRKQDTKKDVNRFVNSLSDEDLNYLIERLLHKRKG